MSDQSGEITNRIPASIGPTRTDVERIEALKSSGPGDRPQVENLTGDDCAQLRQEIREIRTLLQDLAPKALGDADDPMNRLVDADGLLRLLWEPEARPSVAWVRWQTKHKRIPTVRSGGRTWFCPRDVRNALSRQVVKRGRPTKAAAML